MAVLGLDTSNYTTSAALYFPERGEPLQKKQLLPVQPGARGLRQSDAVFHHTVQLPQLVSSLLGEETPRLDAVCASVSPRMQEDSYMPCFLVGAGAGQMIAQSCGVPFYTTSHQHGHVVAALYGAGRLDLLERRFLAFHVSGGTTEALLVEPDADELFRCTCVAQSLDLKAGQAVDRVGVLLGLQFPCGRELDALSLQCSREFHIRPSMKGADCSLSGVENQCRKLIDAGEPPAAVAKFCLESIAAALSSMTLRLKETYGDLPVLYAGGVMSNTLIRTRFQTAFGALFAPPEFSADNAAGVAIIGALKAQKGKPCQQS